MKYYTIAVLTGLLFVAWGCDTTNSNGDDSKPVAVKMQIQTNTMAKQKAVSVDSLTEIKFLVEEFELESVNDDSADFEIEDLVANLPLNGDPIELISGEIPAGLYDEFEMEIENDDDGSSTADSDFFEGDKKYSIVVKGLYNGEEFMFRSAEDFEIELELNPALEISETTSSAAVNINIDPSVWFTDASGNPLDPTDESNWEQIEENIENSFEAEGEEDENDEEDDDEDSDDDDD